MMLKKGEKDNFPVAYEEKRTQHSTGTAGAAQIWGNYWADLQDNVDPGFTP